MVICPNCKTNNDPDASFCTHCGENLNVYKARTTIEKQAKKFASDMERMGKKAGKVASTTAKQIQKETSDVGQRIEQRLDHVGKRTENWYDRTFGIWGPLLSSFLFLIIFRLVVAVIQSIQADSDAMRYNTAIAAVLLTYLLPLFFITLLSNYTSYFSRKYFQVKVFSPLVHAVAFVLFIWIATLILYDLSVRLTISELHTTAFNIQQALPVIFVFVLLIGYVILAANMPRVPDKK